jgi:hypothetical protein
MERDIATVEAGPLGMSGRSRIMRRRASVLSLKLRLEVLPTSFHRLGVQLLFGFPVPLTDEPSRPGALEALQALPPKLY